MLQDCAHVILLKVMHFIEKCIYSWWKMRTRTRFQVLSIYLTVNISAKPLVFPNKSIHVGSCQAHYVVILAILQPFVSLAIRSFQFSRSHFYPTVVAICTFSALIDLRQHYTYVCNSNRFFCVLNIHLKCSCHTLQVFWMMRSTINYEINCNRPRPGFGSKIIVMSARISTQDVNKVVYGHRISFIDIEVT